MQAEIPSPLHESLSPADRLAAAAALRAHDREVFLASARAVPICAREFDRLAEDIAKRATSVDPELTGAKAEVRRSPGRCIVQLGPVALTVSWVRSRVDTVGGGRLLIVEWEGTVARSGERTRERVPALPSGKPATLVRENVLMAVATNEQDWRWQLEDDAQTDFASGELAARCIDSLLETLKDQQH